MGLWQLLVCFPIVFGSRCRRLIGISSLCVPVSKSAFQPKSDSQHGQPLVPRPYVPRGSRIQSQHAGGSVLLIHKIALSASKAKALAPKLKFCFEFPCVQRGRSPLFASPTSGGRRKAMMPNVLLEKTRARLVHGGVTTQGSARLDRPAPPCSLQWASPAAARGDEPLCVIPRSI